MGMLRIRAPLEARVLRGPAHIPRRQGRVINSPPAIIGRPPIRPGHGVKCLPTRTDVIDTGADALRPAEKVQSMAAGVIAETSQVRAALAEVCARNLAAEIHYGEGTDEVRTARVRFLALESDAICTDKPQNVRSGVDLRVGQQIAVFFTQSNTRWAFDSRVQKLSRIVRLNARQRVVGMAIRVPAELKLLQRRRDYRVSVASAGIGCSVALESERYECACDVRSAPLKGMISNVSTRGMAVVIDSDRRRRFDFGTRLLIAFRLPVCEEEFVVRAEVQHAREVRGRQNTVLGLRFLPTPLLDVQALQKKMAHFVAQEQRRKLRRRR